jgi:hypothetical protein
MGSIRDKFTTALDALVAEVKEDRTVVAALLCGSLAHDAVWAGSDIDLVLVTVDEHKTAQGELEEGRALYADGVNVHATLIPRAAFRRIVEGSLANSFLHALLAKGRLLYTHDESLTALCARLAEIGERDTRLQLLAAATAALPPLYKAHKWLVTRADLDYTALWILYAATPLARVEVIGRRLLADREVLPQAMKLNPGFFSTVYADLLNKKKTRKTVEAALAAADGYLAQRAPALFSPVIDHLREVGEARSSSDLEHHFARTFGVECVTTACEYLADRGLIGKASAPVKLTRRSNVEVQELAFFSLADGEERHGR